MTAIDYCQYIGTGIGTTRVTITTATTLDYTLLLITYVYNLFNRSAHSAGPMPDNIEVIVVWLLSNLAGLVGLVCLWRSCFVSSGVEKREDKQTEERERERERER